MIQRRGGMKQEDVCTSSLMQFYRPELGQGEWWKTEQHIETDL